ncbi:MAG: ROK family protein [Ruminococcus sp.]|jgi:glucokinase|nr:ROK family protein [Ruminococcus sp.]
MKYYIGIDLGGTNIKAGAVNENYEILSKVSARTHSHRPAEEIAADMARLSIEAAEKAGISIDDVEWIGIGTPGIADNISGTIPYSNNLGFKDVPMREYINRTIKKDVYIANDANAAAYGEYLAGAAMGAADAVCITLGTGVGAGVIIDGKIFTGRNLAGTEIGHMVIDPNGRRCTCGRDGCFEVFSSATGLIEMTKEKIREFPDSLIARYAEEDGHVSARHAFNAMRAGDKPGKDVVDCYIKYLSIGIANVINIFQPDILCIGGGVCNEGDPLLIPLREQVKEQIYTKMLEKNTEIHVAKLGNDAGIIGAAFLGNTEIRGQRSEVRTEVRCQKTEDR